MQLWKFFEAIVMVAASFPQNMNYGNDNSFPQYVFLNIIVSETFPWGKNKDIYTKSDLFLRFVLEM